MYIYICIHRLTHPAPTCNGADGQQPPPPPKGILTPPPNAPKTHGTQPQAHTWKPPAQTIERGDCLAWSFTKQTLKKKRFAFGGCPCFGLPGTSFPDRRWFIFCGWPSCLWVVHTPSPQITQTRKCVILGLVGLVAGLVANVHPLKYSKNKKKLGVSFFWLALAIPSPDITQQRWVRFA